MASHSVLVGIALALIVIGILLAIGVVVTSQVYENLPNITDTEAQTVISNIKTQTYNAFNFMPVVLIVLVAGGIIAFIRLFGGG